MPKTKKSERCNFDRRPMSFAAREVGCPLDHCACGTHDVDHDCFPDYEPTDDNPYYWDEPDIYGGP